MTNSGATLADLRARWKGTPLETAIRYTLADEHSDRLAAVRDALDFACNELEINKHKKQSLDEDQLTIELCSFLNGLGFQAAHDQQIGGHCDIVVRGEDMFLWLAEAKKHDAYDWLDKGFKQLSTRYSTGVPGQDHGEIVIYCFNKDAASTVKRWKDELTRRNPDVSTDDGAQHNPMHFFSQHVHESSGCTFHVRHKAVALYWRPQDR